MSVKERDSKYEAMRIIAAIAITLNHVPCSENALIINRYTREFFFLGGQFGVNLYVIIGAWFLCDGRFKTERVLRIVIQMVFYSLALDIISFMLGTPVSLSGFLKSFSYWFCFGYVAMLLAAPFLQRLSEKSEIIISILGGVLVTIITIGGHLDPSLLLVRLSLKGVIIGPLWFGYVFVLVSLIKKQWSKITISGTQWLVTFFIIYALMYVVLIVSGKSFIREVCSPICFLSAFSLFAVFAQKEVRRNYLVNRISKYTFGVYLFQAHMLFRSYLWEGIFHFTKISETSYLYVIEALLCVIVVFAFSAAIEEVRIRLMSLQPVEESMNKIASLGDGLYQRLFER